MAPAGPFADSPDTLNASAFPGETAYAYSGYSSDGISFTTEIIQFGTAAAASSFLTAIRGTAQRCTTAQSGPVSTVDVSSGTFDGYPTAGYAAYLSGVWQMLFAADGVDVIYASLIAPTDNSQPPAKPTLPAVTDAVLAGVATISG
jgi:hypothetical protein